ncbi:twitch domain-containing radical SAM protein [bacterium]|nr:twitch domain-containing radical SAM protein [bacterium]
MSFSPSKNFCTLPFVHICNRSDGYFLACCHADGVVTDNDGAPFEINKGHTFEQVFQSNYMNSLRASMLKGARDERCRMCWKLEDLGLNSKRLHDGNRYLDKTIERINNNDSRFMPLSWDIKLGTLCNLKCRMCEPNTSVALMMEAIHQKWIDKETGSNFSKKTKDFLQYAHFQNELINLIPYVEEIYFLGGEPTLIDSHLTVLDAAISNGYANKITIRWSTNLTHFDDRYIQKALQFKKVILDCSVDGFGNVNDYIRYPSKWNMIDAQIKKIKTSLPKALIKIVCTVQIYNIFELEKIIDWSEQLGIQLGFNYLNTPEYLSAQILPTDVKQALINKYSKLSDTRLRDLVRWLSGPENPQLMSDFYKYTLRLDKVRNQDFFTILPKEYLSYLKNYFSEKQIHV